MKGQPDGALFDAVLLLHVAAALVAVGVLATGAVAAVRLARAGGGPVPPGVQRYFAPGTNWAGRTLYAVPLLGLALVGLSGGHFGFGDAWVLTGIGLWAAAALVAEGMVWRTERRVQGDLAAGADPGPAARRLYLSSFAVLAILLAAFVVMFVQP